MFLGRRRNTDLNAEVIQSPWITCDGTCIWGGYTYRCAFPLYILMQLDMNNRVQLVLSPWCFLYDVGLPWDCQWDMAIQAAPCVSHCVCATWVVQIQVSSPRLECLPESLTGVTRICTSQWKTCVVTQTHLTQMSLTQVIWLKFPSLQEHQLELDSPFPLNIQVRMIYEFCLCSVLTSRSYILIFLKNDLTYL